MRHAELIVASMVTPDALLNLVVHILEQVGYILSDITIFNTLIACTFQRGPLPVGEIGKHLQVTFDMNTHVSPL